MNLILTVPGRAADNPLLGSLDGLGVPGSITPDCSGAASAAGGSSGKP